MTKDQHEIAAELREALLEHVKQGDRDAAVQLIDDWASENDYEDAVSTILEPALLSFGRDWGESESISLGQGYVLSKVVEQTLHNMAEERGRGKTPLPVKGPIVLGNILDDSHGLGRKLVKTFLELDGWKVYDLGNDVDPEEFVYTAKEVHAPIIAVSAMMYRTALNIKELRTEINNQGLQNKIKLAAGGAVFCQRPSLVQEVGADGTAINAIKAPELMDSLLKELQSETVQEES